MEKNKVKIIKNFIDILEKNDTTIDNLVESFLEYHQKHMVIINGRPLRFLNLRYIFKWLTDRYILIKKSDYYEENREKKNK